MDDLNALRSELVVWPLVFATAFVLAPALSAGVGTRISLGARMGKAKWDFKDSWASTITVVGGVIATVVSSASLGVPAPDPGVPVNLPRGQYAGLSLGFTFVVFAAALFYNATRQPQEVNAHDGTVELQLQGFVWSFLVAVWITVWAVVGQIATLWFALADMELLRSLTVVARWAFSLVVGVAAICVVIYVWKSLEQTLESQVNETREATAESVTAERERATQLRAPIAEWTLP
jgi:hypothetical protein